jgi:hypothetical protein
MDQQRYFQLLCWVAGSDPDRYDWLTREVGMDRERANQCSNEYRQMRENWLILLETALKY